jgi:hypothetical protein
VIKLQDVKVLVGDQVVHLIGIILIIILLKQIMEEVGQDLDVKQGQLEYPIVKHVVMVLRYNQ